jgi:hypothetical protein
MRASEMVIHALWTFTGCNTESSAHEQAAISVTGVKQDLVRSLDGLATVPSVFIKHSGRLKYVCGCSGSEGSERHGRCARIVVEAKVYPFRGIFKSPQYGYCSL